jgi:hypothetical protein
VGLVLVIAVVLTACATDPTTSDEDTALEQQLAATQQELATTQQQLSDITQELSAAEAELEQTTTTEVPADVVALIDKWWAANERGDGSVADLYQPSGYHVYGAELIPRSGLAAHFNTPSYTKEWITEPYLIAAEPEGRYVVARGLKVSSGSMSWTSAFVFEIVTSRDDELQIAQTDWVKASY